MRKARLAKQSTWKVSSRSVEIPPLGRCRALIDISRWYNHMQRFVSLCQKLEPELSPLSLCGWHDVHCGSHLWLSALRRQLSLFAPLTLKRLAPALILVGSLREDKQGPEKLRCDSKQEVCMDIFVCFKLNVSKSKLSCNRNSSNHCRAKQPVTKTYR